MATSDDVKTETICIVSDDMVGCGYDNGKFGVVHNKQDFESTLFRLADENNQNETKQIFRIAYKNLKKYTPEELHTHWENNDDKWDEWGADLMLFYIARFVLFKQTVPILDEIQTNEILDGTSTHETNYKSDLVLRFNR